MSNECKCHPRIIESRSPAENRNSFVDSFVLITNPSGKSSRQSFLSKLREETKTNTEYEALCSQCFENVFSRWEVEEKGLLKEIDAFEKYGNASEEVNQKRMQPNALLLLQHEHKKLSRDEELLKEAILKAESDMKSLEITSQDVFLAEKELDAKEESFCKESNEYLRSLLAYQEEYDRMEGQNENATSHLFWLTQLNFIQDSFVILDDTVCGSINGFLFGSYDNDVNWMHVNAAWGQVCLLLTLLADYVGLEFKTYRLICSGSSSSIERIDDDSKFELHFVDGADKLGHLFWFRNRRFDMAMIMFLDLMRQFGDFCEKKGTLSRMPFKIHRDKVGDYSVKYHYNQSSSWTNALRRILSNLKWARDTIVAF